MKCLLCREREANKTNTHYLTDSIIRSALNKDSSPVRGKGSYFNMSPGSGTIDYSFQQGLLSEDIEVNLGREATEEEIQEAIDHTEFSVDYHYCDVCETLFGEIEKPFYNDVLPKFRNNDLTGIEEIQTNDIKKIRLFFFLQLLRTSDCHDGFSLPINLHELFRQWVLNYDTITFQEIRDIPLSIAYLQTIDGRYAGNILGVSEGQNPNVIFMNYFVIQCYEIRGPIAFYELPGINEIESFPKFINCNEDSFLVKVIPDAKRKLFIGKLTCQRKFDSIIRECHSALRDPYFESLGVEPTRQLVEQFYFQEIHSSDEPDGVKHKRDNYKEKAIQFVSKNKIWLKRVITKIKK